ncbi:hypothetical protein TanjilG_20160 [Lupinus angustifolius]|uniref:HMA domain-containing protein n=1 Tax=Lupinus angustifolius TaxID=3871 RepID=A0A4P1RCB0_LUPAN|nr:hypothetical protein TanjilG_20160 [Lupinus angustifolius]
MSVDMNDKKLTLIGDIDPIHVVEKLRKLCRTEIISVVPAKEEKKKNEESKPNNKSSTKVSESLKLFEAYPLCYEMRPPHYNQYHYVTSVQEDPFGCVIL